MKIKLPKRFYTAEQLAEKWECKVEDITHLIETGDLLTAERLAALYGKRRICSIPAKPGESKREVLTKVKNFLDKEEVTEVLDKLFGQSVNEYMDDTHYELVYSGNADIPIFDECLMENGLLDPVITADEVSRFEREHGEPDDDTAPPSKWPWGDYETPLLRILAEAVNEFCLSGEYPKKESGEVVRWIMERMEREGLSPSNSLADKIETLISPRPYSHHRQRNQR